jgi:hypothetical protein
MIKLDFHFKDSVEIVLDVGDKASVISQNFATTAI